MIDKGKRNTPSSETYPTSHTVEHTNYSTLKIPSTMMNKAEFRQACEQFEKDFALRAFYIRRQIEEEDKNFVFLGSTTARAVFTEQLKTAHEDKIAELLEASRQELELMYFGPEGRPAEENASGKETPVVSITAKQKTKSDFWQQVRMTYLSIFW